MIIIKLKIVMRHVYSNGKNNDSSRTNVVKLYLPRKEGRKTADYY